MIRTILNYLGVRTELRSGQITATLNSTNIQTRLDVIVQPVAPPVSLTDDLLIESGSFFLLENGDKLILG